MVREEMRTRLIGALIGLARATEGNEHLVNDGTAALVLEGLRAARSADTAGMEEMFHRITEEKRRMVPDCFFCACPCGRTSDYDVTRLQKLPEAVRQLKLQILEAITDAAESAHQAASAAGYDKHICEVFYLALFAMGMDDWEEAQLLSVLKQVQALPAQK